MKPQLSESDYQESAIALGCEVAAVKAVAEVEARGDGFLPDETPKILFEAHIFSRLTNHAYDKTHPSISSSTWNRKLYKGGAAEHDRLAEAVSLERDAAMQSASWGRFQIMGFNFKEAGFPGIQAFVNAMYQGEGGHLKAFVSYIKSTKLDVHLRNKNWAAFAKRYNGPSYAQNKYDEKLQAAYLKYSKET